MGEITAEGANNAKALTECNGLAGPALQGGGAPPEETLNVFSSCHIIVMPVCKWNVNIKQCNTLKKHTKGMAT